MELGIKASGDAAQESPPAALEQAYQEFRAGVVALGGEIGEERQASR